MVWLAALQDRQNSAREGWLSFDLIDFSSFVYCQAPVNYSWMPDHTPNTSGGTAGMFSFEINKLFCLDFRCWHFDGEQERLHALHHHQAKNRVLGSTTEVDFEIADVVFKEYQ